MTDSISPAELSRLLDKKANIKVFDVRLEEDYVEVTYPVPTAEWRNPREVTQWGQQIGAVDEVIVYCVHGHHVSQSTRDALRQQGIKARILEGGIEAWQAFVKDRPLP